MISRSWNMPTLTVLLAASLWCITLLGGCPAAQQPTVPQQDEPAAQEPPSTPDDDLNRPIDQPELDGDDPDADDGSPSDPVTPTGGSTGGGGGDSGQSSPIIITMQQPADPLAVRPGTIVTVEFNLLDLAGAVESGELLVARDDDADGVPDAGSVIPKFPIAMSSESSNVIAFNTNLATGLLVNGFGRFVVGVKAVTIESETTTVYNPATITIDAIPPTASWVGAGSPSSGIPLDRDDHLVNRDISWTFSLSTTDNSPHTVRVMLDQDLEADNGNEFELVQQTTVPAGSGTRSFSAPLVAYPSDTYHYLVTVSDGIEPATVFYTDNPSTDLAARLAVTNRLIGEFDLDNLATSDHGAIMQGFNFNDLAGSSMSSVPDLNGDGNSELLIGARFGKPNLHSFGGTGWGEAYMIYGQSTRLTGVQELNSVGSIDDPDQGGIPGVTFRGVRVPQNTDMTEGLADVAVIDDMDGDDLPEIAFSFPRSESVCLEETDPTIQHPDLIWDEQGMGVLEYNAFYSDMPGMMPPTWHPNEAQFTRGGVVIVSSHNEMLQDNDVWTRTGDRVLDLHEIGQMFNFMVRPSISMYIRSVYIGDPAVGAGAAHFTDPNTPNCFDCDPAATGECGGDPNNPEETPYDFVVRVWDVWLGGG
jgi:hypothetical protein